MKLVELLARELSEWPESAVCITQDDSSYLYAWNEMRPEYRECSWYSPDGKNLGMHDAGLQEEEIALASDQKKSIVTRAQWQAERDRQKGGEWKRHRGGKCPVPVGTKVSTRHRDGKVADVHFHTAMTGSGPATMNAIWKHTGDGHDIMAYKIVSQPQAEEVEVKDTTIGTLSQKVEIDTTEAIQAIDALAAKWDQVDGPLRWRYAVNELDAYIEEFTRERDALINRLALEGFALLPDMTPVMGVSDIILPIEQWKSGDFVTSKTTYNKQFTEGKQYKLTRIYDQYGTKRVSIDQDDKGAANGWLASNFKFHSRP